MRRGGNTTLLDDDGQGVRARVSRDSRPAPSNAEAIDVMMREHNHYMDVK